MPLKRPAGAVPEVTPQQTTVASSPRIAHECADPAATARAPVGAAVATPVQPRSTPTATAIAAPALLSFMRVPSLVDLPLWRLSAGPRDSHEGPASNLDVQPSGLTV